MVLSIKLVCKLPHVIRCNPCMSARWLAGSVLAVATCPKAEMEACWHRVLCRLGRSLALEVETGLACCSITPGSSAYNSAYTQFYSFVFGVVLEEAT